MPTSQSPLTRGTMHVRMAQETGRDRQKPCGRRIARNAQRHGDITPRYGQLTRTWDIGLVTVSFNRRKSNGKHLPLPMAVHEDPRQLRLQMSLDSSCTHLPRTATWRQKCRLPSLCHASEGTIWPSSAPSSDPSLFFKDYDAKIKWR